MHNKKPDNAARIEKAIQKRGVRAGKTDRRVVAILQNEAMTNVSTARVAISPNNHSGSMDAAS